MWCVCAQLYMDQSKKIFDHFICFWKWFLSLFVFMFSAYFVFHCLNMFYVEKQVSEFLATHSGDLQPVSLSCEFWLLVLATLASSEFWWFAQSQNPVASTFRSFCDSLATRENFRNSSRDSPVAKRPESAF